MKTISFLLLAVAALCGLVSLHAAEKIVLGPKGGKLLETTSQKTEFSVNKDHKVEINFYDTASKPMPVGGATVSVTAEPKSGKTPLEMEKTATGFVSKTKLPPGDPYRVVVQLREKADAKPQNFRIALNMEICGECKHPEYACTCGH